MAEEETPNGPEEPETTQGMDVVEDGDKEEQAAEKKDEKKEPKKNKPRKRRKQNITGRKVQVYGKKKKAMAIALCGDGHGMIRVNGRPLDILNPKPMRLKAYEPLLLVGRDKFQDLDIHVRVRGGGPVAQVYDVDEASKQALRETFLSYDRNLIVADPRRRESKKFGGHGARARYQKSYR